MFQKVTEKSNNQLLFDSAEIASKAHLKSLMLLDACMKITCHGLVVTLDALTDNGISPMSVPGDEDMMYTADGLEHNEHGTPSAAVEMHRDQLQKRAKKLSDFDYGKLWADISGEGELAIICWGSVSAVAKEAGERLQQSGQPCRVIALRLIAPLQTEHLLEVLSQCSRILVVEQSHGAQFMAWLRAHIDFPCAHQSLALPGPLPIRPSHILNTFTHWDTHAEEIHHAANC